MIGVQQVLVSTHDKYHAWHRVSPVCRDFHHGWQQVAVCFRLIILLQHGYCTFVIIRFWPSTRLFINLTMCIWALFPEFATTLGLVEQAFWRVPLFTEWIGASFFEVILAGPRDILPLGLLPTGTSGSRRISLILLHEKNSETDSAVSFLHAYWHRDGNCNCLLWDTARWFPIANKLQEFFEHAVLSMDSWPRRFFHNFRFWRQNSYFWYILLDTSFHHCLQSVIVRSYFLLMNLQAIQFQDGLEFLRLPYSQFVQSFQDVVKWNLCHW